MANTTINAPQPKTWYRPRSSARVITPGCSEMKLRNEISAKMIIATPAMSSRASRDRKRSPPGRCLPFVVRVARPGERLPAPAGLLERWPAPMPPGIEVVLVLAVRPPGGGGDVGPCRGGELPVRVVGPPTPGREGELPPDDLPMPPGKLLLEDEPLPGVPGREPGLLRGDGEPGREPGSPPLPGREGELPPDGLPRLPGKPLLEDELLPGMPGRELELLGG